MKTTKLFFAIQAIFIFFFAFNAFGYSVLNLSMYDGSRFYLEFNNEVIKQYAFEFETGHITGGKHYLKVYLESTATGTKRDLIFSDYIFIPEGYKVYAVIDEYGKFLIYKKMTVDYAEYYDNQYYCDCCSRCSEYNKQIDPGKYEESGCDYYVMDGKTFSELKSSVNKVSFESSKKELIEMAAVSNIFYTSQVKELLQTLSFDNTKLELAKSLYSKTCDKENYFTISDVFSFESSYMELKRFIEQNK